MDSNGGLESRSHGLERPYRFCGIDRGRWIFFTGVRDDGVESEGDLDQSDSFSVRGARDVEIFRFLCDAVEADSQSQRTDARTRDQNVSWNGKHCRIRGILWILFFRYAAYK